jgi:hypothetical protein
MLHRLNEAARPEHGWVATVDERDQLMLSTSLPIQETEGTQLQSEVAGALDRAESLTALVNQFTAKASETGADALDTRPVEVNPASFNPLDRA